LRKLLIELPKASTADECEALQPWAFGVTTH
jgi:hypothetical protein